MRRLPPSPLYHSKSRRSRFASRQATALTLRQSRHSPERYGANRRLRTTPSRPCRSAETSERRPSLTGAACSANTTCGPGRRNGLCRGRTKEQDQKGGQHAVRSYSLNPNCHLSTKVQRSISGRDFKPGRTSAVGFKAHTHSAAMTSTCLSSALTSACMQKIPRALRRQVHRSESSAEVAGREAIAMV
jgi:hypothetical protein